MVNYINGKIYKFVHQPTQKLYLGSTAQALSKRRHDHLNKTVGSSLLYQMVLTTNRKDWVIILVCKYPCGSKDELETEEYRHIAAYPEQSMLLNEKGLAKVVAEQEAAQRVVEATAKAVALSRPSAALSEVIHTVLTPQEVHELNTHAQAALADNTKRSYRADVNAFTGYLTERFPDVVDPRKATAEHVAAFLNHEMKSGKCISTVQHRYSCIRKHVLPHLPGQEWTAIAQMMRGMKRTAAITGKGAATTGKQPLLLADLQKVLGTAVCDAAEGKLIARQQVRDRALLLYM